MLICGKKKKKDIEKKQINKSDLVRCPVGRLFYILKYKNNTKFNYRQNQYFIIE